MAVESALSIGFAPANYLFGQQGVSETRSWMSTALAVALLIPGLILGCIAKLFALICSSRAHQNSRPIKANQPEVVVTSIPEEEPIESSHSELAKMLQSIKMRLANARNNIWNDSDFVGIVNMTMQHAYREMQIYFRDLQKHHPDNPTMKAMQMLDYGATPDYCRLFFYDSLTELYHMARACVYVVKVENRPSYRFPNLGENDIDPYFDPAHIKSQWRKMYNKFCDIVTESGVRPFLQQKDGRFNSWSKKDEDRTMMRYLFPDTRPT